jgi:YD repeat-containing protein
MALEVMRSARKGKRLGTAIVSLLFLLASGNVNAATIYSYDLAGRITSALYDSGVCVVYTYDANGNRTAQVNTTGGAPATPTWGTGVLGCFNWTP